MQLDRPVEKRFITACCNPPDDHLMGAYMTLQKRKETFIAKATAKHGGFYDYSLVNYISSRDKVEIICPDHGVFLQSPASHLTSRCFKCAVIGMSEKKRKTKEQFVSDAVSVHGNKYDYSKVVYTGNKDKVSLICIEHGEFRIAPTDHLKGGGCAECSFDRLRLKTDGFIGKATAIHGGKFDYSLVACEAASDVVDIICSVHGAFQQRASDHMSGYGCAACAGTKKLTTYDFIARSKMVHGNRYIYDEVKYTSSHRVVKIKCPEHGTFKQQAYKHLQGQGCALCTDWLSGRSYVYVLTSSIGLSKIGLSKDVESRNEKLMDRGQPFKSKVARYWAFQNFHDSVKVEKAAHKVLQSKRAGLTGFDGATEWFNVSVDEAITAVQSEVYKATEIQ